jgi:hypothetical protein
MISSFFDFDFTKCPNDKKCIFDFKLPISYLDKDKLFKLPDTVTQDLDIHNDSSGNLYSFLFNPDNEFSQENMKLWNEYYTNDITFLNDTQNIISNMDSLNISYTKFDSINNIWNETKNNSNFYGKYNYFEWNILKSFNLSSLLMLILCILQLSTPFFFFIAPIIVLIIPFFILKFQGLPISISIYYNVVCSLIKDKLFGKFLDKFESLNFYALAYMFACIVFYIIQLYQNVNTCYVFYNNIKNVNNYIDDLSEYISSSIKNINQFYSISKNCITYSHFNQILLEKQNHLSNLLKELSHVSSFSNSLSKIHEFGKLLRCFYIIHSDNNYESALQFSTGFNGYLYNIHNVHLLIKQNHLNLAEFSPSFNCNIKDQYYPNLINNDSLVKNNIDLSNNIIITGPNASGKTTLIKTTTLNVIFSQQLGCGFYKSCQINPYTHIHSYINIPDTSNRDSLFQAESRRCKDIIDIILKYPSQNYRHFCIFDELYSGTNPVEASQAGYAFLKYLSKFKHVDFILTTHYVYICKKFKKSTHIKNFKMKVEFDNFQNYLFKYKMIPGISEIKGAIKVLKDLEYPSEIINTIEKI